MKVKHTYFNHTKKIKNYYRNITSQIIDLIS